MLYVDPDSFAPPDRIKLIAEGFNVEPLAHALAHHPELWDQNTGRTAPPDSPHHGASDIWCRFAPAGTNGHQPHTSVWFPAAQHLPVRAYAREMMALVGGEQLGGILITRVAPRSRILPHVDPGWHARFYDKIALQVAANPQQAYCFEGQELVTKPGDVFWFDNARTHWVENPSDEARITAIFCIRVHRNQGTLQ